jgi:hypothetical protein
VWCEERSGERVWRRLWQVDMLWSLGHCTGNRGIVGLFQASALPNAVAVERAWNAEACATRMTTVSQSQMRRGKVVFSCDTKRKGLIGSSSAASVDE